MTIYKRLEAHRFAWPPLREGMMQLSHAQFEALFAGLDWRRVSLTSSLEALVNGHRQSRIEGLLPCNHATTHGV